MSITIENIMDADLLEFADWLDNNVLGIRLPQPGPNTAASTVMPEVRSLLAVIPNRISFATELYAIVTAKMAAYKVDQRRLGNNKTTAKDDDNTARMMCMQDLLYRSIQTLQTQYESASRMITVMDSENKMRGHGE